MLHETMEDLVELNRIQTNLTGWRKILDDAYLAVGNYTGFEKAVQFCEKHETRYGNHELVSCALQYAGWDIQESDHREARQND